MIVGIFWFFVSECFREVSCYGFFLVNKIKSVGFCEINNIIIVISFIGL